MGSQAWMGRTRAYEAKGKRDRQPSDDARCVGGTLACGTGTAGTGCRRGKGDGRSGTRGDGHGRPSVQDRHSVYGARTGMAGMGCGVPTGCTRGDGAYDRGQGKVEDAGGANVAGAGRRRPSRGGAWAGPWHAGQVQRVRDTGVRRSNLTRSCVGNPISGPEIYGRCAHGRLQACRRVQRQGRRAQQARWWQQER